MKSNLYKLCEFDSRNQKLSLLYRGSLHGFKCDDFHSKCDHIPKTLTVIKAKSGNIFGGYTEATWDRVSKYKKDKNAFIFSLVNLKKTTLKVNLENASCAIYCHPNYGPSFGDDINISDDSNYSNFGKFYVHENYPLGSEKAKQFLAGSHEFFVEEIEVYQLE
jgi:hypothetical protein